MKNDKIYAALAFSTLVAAISVSIACYADIGVIAFSPFTYWTWIIATPVALVTNTIVLAVDVYLLSKLV